MKFRRKPAIIEATQWLKHGDHPAVSVIPEWHDFRQTLPFDWERFGHIATLEGGHIVTPGDWIITGIAGEHYPCKPTIFEAIYESVQGFDERH